jgi:periplasmic protein CpxP/Spy
MNNSRNKVLVFFIALLLLTNIGILFYFIGGRGPGRGSHGDKRGGLVTSFLRNEIGFTKQQMDDFDNLKQQHRTAIKPLFDDLGKSKDSFYVLIGNPAIPDTVLRSAADAIGKKQAALDLQFYQNFQSIRKLCTPEQQIKFDSLMPAIASKMMQPWRRNNASKKDDSARRN